MDGEEAGRGYPLFVAARARGSGTNGGKMQIQSDLIILPPTFHLPLPWSVRGPLGLESGSEVTIALVQSESESKESRLPDIIVTPLQTNFLHRTFVLDVEMPERAGAVANFLSLLGEAIFARTGNAVNIVLSETITLEGRQRHRMHLVLEPTPQSATGPEEIHSVVDTVRESSDIEGLKVTLRPILEGQQRPSFLLEQKVRVENGWIQFTGWIKKIERTYENLMSDYDISRVVVSSSPEQRLLRYIIPKRGVVEIRVPHNNTPGALLQISKAIHSANYNILSSRLSRTPPRNFAASTSVFVAACEPLDLSCSASEIVRRLEAIKSGYMIADVGVTHGREAEKSRYLTPRRREIVQLDDRIATEKLRVREEAGQDYARRHDGRRPRLFVFVSRRFISQSPHKQTHKEQAKLLKFIGQTLENQECAVIWAPNPSNTSKTASDDQVHTAVFSHLWAADACLVLALHEDGSGTLSLSMAHEIGFFSGRNRPFKVLVSQSREKDPVFGNTVGKNRAVYADGPAAFQKEDEHSISAILSSWIRSIALP